MLLLGGADASSFGVALQVGFLSLLRLLRLQRLLRGALEFFESAHKRKQGAKGIMPPAPCSEAFRSVSILWLWDSRQPISRLRVADGAHRTGVLAVKGLVCPAWSGVQRRAEVVLAAVERIP